MKKYRISCAELIRMILSICRTAPDNVIEYLNVIVRDVYNENRRFTEWNR